MECVPAERVLHYQARSIKGVAEPNSADCVVFLIPDRVGGAGMCGFSFYNRDCGVLNREVWDFQIDESALAYARWRRARYGVEVTGGVNFIVASRSSTYSSLQCNARQIRLRTELRA